MPRAIVKKSSRQARPTRRAGSSTARRCGGVAHPRARSALVLVDEAKSNASRELASSCCARVSCASSPCFCSIDSMCRH